MSDIKFDTSKYEHPGVDELQREADEIQSNAKKSLEFMKPAFKKLVDDIKSDKISIKLKCFAFCAGEVKTIDAEISKILSDETYMRSINLSVHLKDIMIFYNIAAVYWNIASRSFATTTKAKKTLSDNCKKYGDMYSEATRDIRKHVDDVHHLFWELTHDLVGVIYEHFTTKEGYANAALIEMRKWIRKDCEDYLYQCIKSPCNLAKRVLIEVKTWEGMCKIIAVNGMFHRSSSQSDKTSLDVLGTVVAKVSAMSEEKLASELGISKDDVDTLNKAFVCEHAVEHVAKKRRVE